MIHPMLSARTGERVVSESTRSRLQAGIYVEKLGHLCRDSSVLLIDSVQACCVLAPYLLERIPARVTGTHRLPQCAGRLDGAAVDAEEDVLPLARLNEVIKVPTRVPRD